MSNWVKLLVGGAAAGLAVVLLGWFAGGESESEDKNARGARKGVRKSGSNIKDSGRTRKVTSSAEGYGEEMPQLEGVEDEEQMMKALQPKERLLIQGAKYIQNKEYGKAEQALSQLLGLLDENDEADLKLTIMHKLALLAQEQKQLVKA